MSAMGAPESKLQEWFEYYSPKLLPAIDIDIIAFTSSSPSIDASTASKILGEDTRNTPPSVEATTPSINLNRANWQQHRERTREHYDAFLKYYDTVIREEGVEETLTQHVPHLTAGLIGALLHPVIHLGLGIHAGSESMIAEGLAYMSVAYQPIATEPLPTRSSPILWTSDDNDSNALEPVEATARFVEFAKEQGLVKVAVEAGQTDKFKRLKVGGIQESILPFDDVDLPLGAALNSIVLKLPSIEEDLEPVIQQLLALMASTYLASDNEFVVIHGTTSLTSVIALLPYLTPHEQRDAISHWWRAVMCAIVAQRLPLGKTFELMAKWTKEMTELETPRSSTTQVGQTTSSAEQEGDNDTWKSLVAKSWASEDEHVQKGVYCMWMWSQWSCMSDEPSQRLLMTVAKNQVRPHPSGKLSNNLWFGNRGKDELPSDLTLAGRNEPKL